MRIVYVKKHILHLCNFEFFIPLSLDLSISNTIVFLWLNSNLGPLKKPGRELGIMDNKALSLSLYRTFTKIGRGHLSSHSSVVGMLILP